MEHGIRRISNALCASASAAALVVCCVSCAHSTTEDVGYLEGFTTSGAFLVVRLSSQGIRNGLPPDTANGYLVAFQQDGSMSAAWTQGLLSSEMTWNGPVLSVGDSAYEYLITDDGASAFPRTVDGGHEVGRFVSSTDGSVLSFYVEGPVQRAYNIDSGGIRDRSENQEFYLTNGECGGRVLSSTSTRITPILQESASEFAASRPPSAAESDGAQSDSAESGAPDGYDILAQVYPHDGDLPPVLAVAPRETRIEVFRTDLWCADDVFYHLMYLDSPEFVTRDSDGDEGRTTIFLNEWDLGTGERRIRMVTDEEGAPFAVGYQETAFFGQYDEQFYTFATPYGHVFKLDAQSARVTQLATLPLAKPELRSARFYVRDGYAYAIESSEDGEAPPQFSACRLSDGRCSTPKPLEGLEKKMRGSLLGGEQVLQSFAVRPGYIPDIDS